MELLHGVALGIIGNGWDEKNLTAHPVPTHGLVVSHQSRLPKAPLNSPWGTCRDVAISFLWATSENLSSKPSSCRLALEGSTKVMPGLRKLKIDKAGSNQKVLREPAVSKGSTSSPACN